MAFLNEQGVKTLWEKIKAHTETAMDSVEAKIPVEALTIKGNGTVVETFNGSNPGVVDIVAGDNITVKADAETGKITIESNGELTGVIDEAKKVSNALTIKMNNSTIEYDGSAIKEVNITPAAIGAATTTALSNTNTNITKIVNGETKVEKAKTADTATSAGKLTAAVNIALNGDVSGSASFDGSKDISITTTVADDSHAHSDYATKEQHNNLVAEVGNKLEQSDLDNYATKTYADTAETDAIAAAKTYTDEAIAKIYEVDNTDTITSILELSAAIKDNDDAIDSLNQIAGTKLSNTTAITAGTGISVTNSGVLANGVEISNTGIVTLAVGTGNNGTTKVNGTNTTLVKGLNTAAYKADTYFATATGLNDLVARIAPIESGYVKEFEFKMANATKTDGTDVASATVASNKATITLYAIPDSFFNSEFFN